MNHLNALASVGRAHPRVGLGQINLLPPDIVSGVKELIALNTADAKKDIIAEVDKKGEEAKKNALYGGLAAGAVGVALGALVVYAVK
jgi:hypothetical protein